MQWKKDGEGWVCEVVDVMTVKVTPKADGRFGWEVFPCDGGRALASGVATSLGAAKATGENFVKRSGKV